MNRLGPEPLRGLGWGWVGVMWVTGKREGLVGWGWVGLGLGYWDGNGVEEKGLEPRLPWGFERGSGVQSHWVIGGGYVTRWFTLVVVQRRKRR